MLVPCVTTTKISMISKFAKHNIEYQTFIFVVEHQNFALDSTNNKTRAKNLTILYATEIS